MLTTPIWLVALLVAAAAPFCVRMFAQAVEKDLRQRTEAAVTRARRAPARITATAEPAPGAAEVRGSAQTAREGAEG